MNRLSSKDKVSDDVRGRLASIRGAAGQGADPWGKPRSPWGRAQSTAGGSTGWRAGWHDQRGPTPTSAPRALPQGKCAANLNAHSLTHNPELGGPRKTLRTPQAHPTPARSNPPVSKTYKRISTETHSCLLRGTPRPNMERSNPTHSYTQAHTPRSFSSPAHFPKHTASEVSWAPSARVLSSPILRLRALPTRLQLHLQLWPVCLSGYRSLGLPAREQELPEAQGVATLALGGLLFTSESWVKRNPGLLALSQAKPSSQQGSPTPVMLRVTGGGGHWGRGAAGKQMGGRFTAS